MNQIRRNEIEAISDPLNHCRVVYGLAGMGKSRLIQNFLKLIENSAESPLQTISICCRPGFSETELSSIISDRISLITGKNPFPGKHPDPSTLSSVLDRFSLLLHIDDFHLVENTFTLELLSAACTLKTGVLLVSTRKKPDLKDTPGLLLLKLEGLNLEDTTEMILSLGRLQNTDFNTEKIINSVYQISKGHPLTIKLIIGLIIMRKITVSEIHEKSRNLRENLDRSLTGIIWENLSDSSRNLLKLLSAWKIPADLSRISAEISSFLSDSSISELHQWCLLEKDSREFVFLHDLPKEIIRSFLSSEELQNLEMMIASSQFSEAGFDISMLLSALLHLDFEKNSDLSEKIIWRTASLIFQTEFSSKEMLSLLEEIQRKKSFPSEDLNFAISLSYCSCGFLSQAEKTMAQFQTWRSQFIQAKILTLKGNHQDSLNMLLESLKSCDDLSSQLMIQIFIGREYGNLGNCTDAENILRKTALHPEISSFPLVHALCLLDLSIILSSMLQFQESLKLSIESENLFRKVHCLQRMSTIIASRAATYLNSGDLENARKSAEYVLNKTSAGGKSTVRAYCHMILGTIYNSSGDYALVKAHLEKALFINASSGGSYMTNGILAKLGEACTRTGDFLEAERHFSRMLTQLEKIDHAESYGNAASCYLPYLIVTGKTEEACFFARKSLSFVEDTPHWKSDVLYYLAKALYLKGETEEHDRLIEEVTEIRSRFNLGNCKGEDRDPWLEEKITNLLNTVSVVINGKNSKIPESGLSQLQENSEFALFADFRHSKISVDGKNIDLSRKKMLLGILRCLSKNHGDFVKIPQIFSEVWGKKYDSDKDINTFRVNITLLRKTLDCSNTHRFIINSGTQYRLNPDISHCLIDP